MSQRTTKQKLLIGLGVLVLIVFAWLVLLGRIAGAAEATDYTATQVGDAQAYVEVASGWSVPITTNERLFAVIAATHGGPSVDESAEEPVAHIATASCRHFKRIRNKHTKKNVFGVWVWKLTMRTSWCYTGRSVQKIYPADLRWEIAGWAYNSGMRWKGPYKRAANCYPYNGIDNHNCLWKNEWINILSAPLIGFGEAAPQHHCLGTRVYGDGHHRRSFAC